MHAEALEVLGKLMIEPHAKTGTLVLRVSSFWARDCVTQLVSILSFQWLYTFETKLTGKQ